jgi:hypothetical protein
VPGTNLSLVRKITVAVVAIGLSGLLAACGDDHVETASVERNLEALVEEASSIAVEAKCPAEVKAEAGTGFSCTVTAAGRDYEVSGEVVDAAEAGQPWTFDEDDLHVGPSTLTCAQLRQDRGWMSAADHLLTREGVATADDEGRAQQVQSVAKLFTDQCRTAAPGLVPYPVVAAQVASP